VWSLIIVWKRAAKTFCTITRLVFGVPLPIKYRFGHKQFI